MRRAAHILGWVALVVGVATSALAADHAGPKPIDPAEAEGVIFDRQQIMLALEKDADTLGRIVAGEIPPDKLAATAHAIAKGAHDSLEAFKEQAPGGRSKPEVWSNNADFMKRMEAFASNADAMAKLADTGNVTAVTSTMGDALPCKQCHDVYREPKKDSLAQTPRW